ncbi:MAG: prepilin-type N-terminal cleavage/methylation domain-containing protein [Candidatus Omnitrophica bacterium]|nr:prepilin-type N-terminal cleavage/methylation domain-containing protein [Candidatus Omnitrophota bacterium]
MRNSLAFTLVELLMVMVIVSIIVALSVPNFSKSFKRLELKKTAGDIVYVVRWAQSRAMTEHVDYKLVFVNDLRGYQVLRGDSTEGQTNQAFSLVSTSMGRVFVIPDSVTIDHNQTINIYCDGTLDKARIRLFNDQESVILSTMEQRGHMFILEDTHES